MDAGASILAGAPLFQIAAPEAVRRALRDLSIGAFASRIPPWQRPAMHSSRKETGPCRGSVVGHNGNHDVTASIRSL